MRRRRILLAAGGGAIVVAALLLCIALSRGWGGLARFFTVPSLEAKSGRKYTPQGVVKRYFEKLDEKKEEPE